MAVPLFLRSQPISTERGGARAAVKRDGAVDSRESLLRRQRVYDPLLRLIHAWNAVCIVGLIASAELDFLAANVIGNEFRWQMHVWLGYGLTVGLVARLVWGFTGPAHARWRDLWHPDEWAGALRSASLITVKRCAH